MESIYYHGQTCFTVTTNKFRRNPIVITLNTRLHLKTNFLIRNPQITLDGNVIFIDTENTFRSERIFQKAEHRGFSPDEILRQIYVCKIYNTSHLEMIIQDLGKSIDEYNAKLVTVDSIIALHRAEFISSDVVVTTKIIP